MLLLLAQATDPISGGAGWVGAGLLGLVLSWLLWVHLPAKDKLIKDMLDTHYTRQDAAMAHFSESLKEVTGHCEQEMSMLIETWKGEVGKITEAMRKEK